jgi:hypothetical protein
MIATAAASEINPGGKKISTGGSGRAVFVLSSPPKVFNAEIDRFIGIPDKIGGNVVGVIKGKGIDTLPHNSSTPSLYYTSLLSSLFQGSGFKGSGFQVD